MILFIKRYLRSFQWCFCFFAFCTAPSAFAINYAKHPASYAVASAHPLATHAGLAILAAGGNAFDAAIAVSAALAVVEPYHSGLGGGGFWLLHQEKYNKDIVIDGREVAPMAATEKMFLDKNGQLIPSLSLNGGLASAIPGEPAALVFMAKHYGRLSLAQILAPAIRLADEGFIVDDQLSQCFYMDDRLEQLKKHPASAAIFLKEGKPYAVGERLIQHDLAKTLRLLAEQGQDGFYKGEVADRLVASVNKAGGIWTLKDLAAYQIKVREPLKGSFHQMQVITVPPPAAGGVALLTMLNILSGYPLSSFNQAEWVHYLVEAMRMAFWQRMAFLGDPDSVDIPLLRLLSQENAQYLRERIHSHRATPSASLSAKVRNNTESSSTTHFSIIDKEGNRVAGTLTLNYIFGSSVVAEGTGVLLNDEMDDFSIAPGQKNVFGLVGGIKNSIAPGRRPLSSMAPAFLEMPGRVAILGTPGGSRIPGMVLLASLVFNDGYGAISMVSAMRFHHQYLPDVLQFEPETFPLTLQKQLQQMGYQLSPLQQYYGDMQAITWDRVQNLVTAASDPRHIGLSVTVGDLSGGYGFAH